MRDVGGTQNPQVVYSPSHPVEVLRQGDTAPTEHATLATALASITTAGTYTVTVFADQSLEGHTAEGASGFFNVAGAHITLLGAAPVQIRLSSNGRMFTISGNNVSLTLGANVTLVGRSAGGNGNENNNNNVVSVQSGGSFTMQNGSMVTGNTSAASSSAQTSQRLLGSAVSVDGSSSEFTMEGGSITGNHAIQVGVNPFATGGLYINANPTVNLKGGSISGNEGANNDIYAASGTANLTLSGNVNIGTIQMAAMSNQSAIITIESGWSGSIGTIHLISNNIWNNQRVLQGTGLDTAAVGRVGLGNFIDDTNSNILIIRPIAATHRIADSGANIGRLVAM